MAHEGDQGIVKTVAVSALSETYGTMFSLREVSRSEVLQTLNSLRSDCSTDPDMIPIKFVKLVTDTVVRPLTATVNNCITNG